MRSLLPSNSFIVRITQRTKSGVETKSQNTSQNPTKKKTRPYRIRWMEKKFNILLFHFRQPRTVWSDVNNSNTCKPSSRRHTLTLTPTPTLHVHQPFYLSAIDSNFSANIVRAFCLVRGMTGHMPRKPNAYPNHLGCVRMGKDKWSAATKRQTRTGNTKKKSQMKSEKGVCTLSSATG